MLFNTDMVRAILAGTKTVTRRAIKPQPDKRLTEGNGRDIMAAACAPYKPGDILYVRETWAATPNGQDYLYRADADGNAVKDRSGNWHVPKWRPSIHMPAEAARIFLRVTAVRVERLQEIDGAGIKAEGTEGKFGATRGAFANLWNSTIKPTEHAAFGWMANPWVWVIEFERCERPKEG